MKSEIEAIINDSSKPPRERLELVIAFLDKILEPKKDPVDKENVITNISIHDFEPIPFFAD